MCLFLNESLELLYRKMDDFGGGGSLPLSVYRLNRKLTWPLGRFVCIVIIQFVASVVNVSFARLFRRYVATPSSLRRFRFTRKKYRAMQLNTDEGVGCTKCIYISTLI